MNVMQALPVRFTAEQLAAIEAISQDSGLSRSEIIRLAVDQFLAQLNDKGEVVVEKVIKAPRTQKPASQSTASKKNS